MEHRSLLEHGYSRLRDFGEVVEGFARFSRLLDVNFDAVHGTFSSILRCVVFAISFSVWVCFP